MLLAVATRSWFVACAEREGTCSFDFAVANLFSPGMALPPLGASLPVTARPSVEVLLSDTFAVRGGQNRQHREVLFALVLPPAVHYLQV